MQWHGTRKFDSLRSLRANGELYKKDAIMNIIARTATLGLLLNTAHLEAIQLFSRSSQKSSESWFTKKTIIGGALIIGAAVALYYYLKPVPTETLKARAEAAFQENRTRYYACDGQPDDQLIRNLETMGRTRDLGYWQWYGQQDCLGEECRYTAPLLRGIALVNKDIAELRKHQQNLDERFGSSQEASRNLYNYDNITRLCQILHKMANKIARTQKFSDERNNFNRHIRSLQEQQRTREVAEENNRRLARIERKLDRKDSRP